MPGDDGDGDGDGVSRTDERARLRLPSISCEPVSLVQASDKHDTLAYRQSFLCILQDPLGFTAQNRR